MSKNRQKRHKVKKGRKKGKKGMSRLWTPEGEQILIGIFYKTLSKGLKFMPRNVFFDWLFFDRVPFFDRNHNFRSKNAFFMTKFGNFVPKMPFFWRGAFFWHGAFFDKNLKTDCQKKGTGGVYKALFRLRVFF